MERSDKSVEFELDGLHVRMTLVGERWVARVGHGVAVGPNAGQALSAALDMLGKASIRALLADLGLLGPSIKIAEIERAAQTA
jgi:hypothetical protein